MTDPVISTPLTAPDRESALVRAIDAVLPQTQCGLCGHAAGCLPYARSIAQGEAANKCIPGGQPVADALAHLLQRPPLPAEPSVWPLAADGRPQRMLAVIREAECIGCTKCLAACPVDAIIGTGKMMHTVIAAACTGCELCLAPCPVDCIDLVPDLSPVPDPEQRQTEQQQLRQRYQSHVRRETLREQQRLANRPKVQASVVTLPSVEPVAAPLSAPPVHLQDVQSTIHAATLRSQLKKLQRQLALQPTQALAQQIADLQRQLDALNMR